MTARGSERREREDAVFELSNRFCEHAKDGELGKLAQADIAMISYRLELSVGLEEKVRLQKLERARLNDALELVMKQGRERLEAIRAAAHIFEALMMIEGDDMLTVQLWLESAVVKGALER